MLENKKIKLRLIEETDFETILSWENTPKFWIISGTQIPFSKALIRAYISDSQDIYKVKQVRLMIEEKEKETVLGCVDLFEFDPNNLNAGIGILIDSKHQNKGIGSQAISLIEQYAKNILNVKNLHCSMLSSNLGSIKLFEKCNFNRIGIRKNWKRVGNSWEDEYLYQKEI